MARLLLGVAALIASSVALAPPSNGGWYRLPTPAAYSQRVANARDGTTTSISEAISKQPGYSLVVLGTYPSDFNMIEYGQNLRYYLPELKERGVTKVVAVVNGNAQAVVQMADMLDLPPADSVELLADPSGALGREWGVSRGWLPDAALPAYAKLFGMLLGLGALATLPSVITGYLGNPKGKNGWIAAAIQQGQAAGRWPDNVITDDGGNKFDDLPVVGAWGRRPLELATLRLQNMIGVSINNWDALKPVDDRCLTQLGGCALFDEQNELTFFWRDNGICNVADFDALLEALPAGAIPSAPGALATA
ncbi:hypothetical protein M885DRAFT_569395 [Pelagophyceae sp. CCMP2097]|nr:hypothetical protein M885DRAFT_569395 [Pelagophyceae sp. CCMP2097]